MKKNNRLLDETGAATAEYAIATMAAVGFAGLLVVIMRSDEVRTILFDLVKSALTFTNPNQDAAPVDPAPAP
jgi:Flp pilus assembly pilin Flp